MKIMEEKEYRMFTKPAEVSKAINTLKGIIDGIEIDNVVNDKEISELRFWCELHKHLENKEPFNEIIAIIQNSCEDDILTYEEVEDIKYVLNNISSKEYYDMITADVQRLQGIFHGIVADEIIADEEIYKLQDWIEEHTFLKKHYPYDEIHNMLSNILNDKIISEDEKEKLLVFFSEFVNTKKSYNLNDLEIQKLKDKHKMSLIYASAQDISVENKTFCFSGISDKIESRTEFKKIIEANGGIYSDIVTKKVDYLIVGNISNDCWAFDKYGRKVEKALDMRKNGSPILIIHENDFWNALDN